MFKSINFKKVTAISFLAILMAGNLLTQPAVSGNKYKKNQQSTSKKNNGHGNNCDGIDSSNPGNGSPNGNNHNHNETNPNIDDEGRGNCSTGSNSNNNSNRRPQDSRGQQQENALVPTASFEGQVDYVVTGGTLRKKSNKNNNDASSLKNSSSGSLSGIPSNATIEKAYLYWAGSGSTVDDTVKFNGNSVTADRTYTEAISAIGKTFKFFQGVKDVTTIVQSNGNGDYTFKQLSVDNSGQYKDTQTVLSGWSLVVIFKDPSITKLNTIELYEGFEGSVRESKNYTLDGIKVSNSPKAKFSMLLWEGDKTLGGDNESFKFNNNILKDDYNPKKNQFNSSINTLGSNKIYGVDFDTFNVSNYVSEGDTSITGSITTDDDLVIQGAAVVMVSDDLAVLTGGGDDGSSGNNGSNNSPEANDDTLETPYGSTNISVYVLDNDTDPDGDDLVVTSVSNRNAKIQNNTVVYTPPSSDFEGTVEFEYTVEDSKGAEDSATIWVTVEPNQAPDAQDDLATTPYNSNIQVDVLNNDTDPEGHTLTILDTVTTSKGGTVTVNNNISTPNDGGAGVNTGNLVYTPPSGFDGTDEVTYTVRDSEGKEDSATITVTVEPSNNLGPTALADTSSTSRRTPVTIDVLSNDTDPENLDSDPNNDDNLTIFAVTNPLHGTAVELGGQVVYTPKAGYNGEDIFRYTIRDSVGNESSAEVTVTINKRIYAD